MKAVTGGGQVDSSDAVLPAHHYVGYNIGNVANEKGLSASQRIDTWYIVAFFRTGDIPVDKGPQLSVDRDKWGRSKAIASLRKGG